MRRIVGWLSLSALLVGTVGCGAPPGTPGDLDLRFARQAIDGPCPETWASDPSPPTLEKLEVVLWGPDGELHDTHAMIPDRSFLHRQ